MAESVRVDAMNGVRPYIQGWWRLWVGAMLSWSVGYASWGMFTGGGSHSVVVSLRWVARRSFTGPARHAVVWARNELIK